MDTIKLRQVFEKLDGALERTDARSGGSSMTQQTILPARWEVVLERMFEELRSGSPRAEVYWAQQLAFGPVFFYAVLLAVRGGNLLPDHLTSLQRVVPLALSLLGALPDGKDAGPDPANLPALAHRQAQALALGRRRQLNRLAARLGLEVSSRPYDPVPRRLQRSYELIGWCPPGE